MDDTPAMYARFARNPGLGSFRTAASACTVVCALLGTGAPAHAFDIELDNPDIKARWDTTVGYSVGVRTQKPSSVLTAGPGAINFNDGDLNFSKRKRPITNRLDVFTEADVSYQGFGARISAAAWYDAAYMGGTSNTSGLVAFPPPAAFNQARTLNDGSTGEFTDAAKAIHGQRAEVLDAFVFGKVSLGSMPLNLRLGRHALLWGESLFFGANAIAAGMAPIDIVKAQSSPNAQVKEIIRPVGQLSGQLQVTQDVSVGAYYQFEWQKSRLPAAGSYFSTNDTIDVGGERLYVVTPGGVLAVPRGADQKAPDSGQFGLQTHFRLPISDADFGLYAIQYHSKLPVGYMTVPTRYWLVYPEKIKAFGASFNNTVGIFNFAGETSIRTNAPLTRGLIPLGGAGTPYPVDTINADDRPGYPVGRTAHINLSTIVAVPSNSVIRESSLTAEMAWNRVLSCTTNCSNSTSPTGYAPRDGNAERDAWGLRMVYSSVFRQAFDGIDLTVPIGLSYSPESQSGAIGPLFAYRGGDLSIGVTANVRETFSVTLSGTHFYGSALPPNNAVGFFNFRQSLRDRDFVTLSARMSF